MKQCGNEVFWERMALTVRERDHFWVVLRDKVWILENEFWLRGFSKVLGSVGE